MTGVIRKATLLVALGLLAASAAMAGIPDPAHCLVVKSLTPPLVAVDFIDVMGTDGAVVDPFGTFTVIVKDIGNYPVTNSVVTIDFAGAPDISLCTDFQPAGQTVVCDVVSKTTDVNGYATFTIPGAGRDNGGLVGGGGLGAVVVRADTWVIANLTAAAYDLNGAAIGGSPGVSSLDASVFSTDNGLFGGCPAPPTYAGRCDFSHDGCITSIDASFASTLRGYGTSAAGCTYCP